MDKLVLDTYTPADGTYVFLEETENGFSQKKLLEVKQDKKTKLLNITEEERIKISYYDYNSRLVDMNKPIDSKKVIQSNNYLSFWVKKDSFNKDKTTQKMKLTEERIDYYYEILSNPYKKYSKSKSDMNMYALAEKEAGSINQKKLQKIKNWIKLNIYNLPYNLKGKDYLKIFFICEGIDFEKESARYIIPNIFNKNDYNIEIEENILGLPNENMGLNSKKPYLENKNRKVKVPVLESTQQIMVRKKFFDYLWNLASSGKSNIYFNIEKNRIYPYDYKTSPDSEFKGYYLRIKKDKNEAAIVEMDLITSYKPNLEKPLLIENVVDMDIKKLEGHVYGRVTKLHDIKQLVNEVFFSKFLVRNFFTEPRDMSINDTVIKESILIARNALFNWFYKGYENGVSNIMQKVSLNLIVNSISNNYLDKAQHQFNLRVAFLEYFKGGNRKMADVMKEIRETLREKINSKEYVSIGSDGEYYYAVGQIIRYFISLNKSTKRNHSLFNPFLSIKSDKILKEKIELFFKKYNYAIEERSLRFNNIFNLIISYQPETEMNNDNMIAGYISNNLIYEKKEEK